MPIRHQDVFEDLTTRLKLEVNPYVSELMAGAAALPALYGPSLKGLRGQWRERFMTLPPPKGRPPQGLILEIGMHKGLSLRAMARAHPELAFVGLDITFKRVVLTARKSREEKLTNVVSVLADARHLPSLFAPGEISGIVAFFPDPWTKKKSQLHKQLFSPDFCAILAGVLAQGGFFWLKTDSQSYFSAVQSHLLTAGFHPLGSPSGLLTEAYESCFEAAFKAKNQAIYEGMWTNASQQSAP